MHGTSWEFVWISYVVVDIFLVLPREDYTEQSGLD